MVISHLHADHILDLIPFASGLTYAPRQQPVPVDRWPGTDSPARPRLHMPAGGRDAMRRICGGGGMLEDHVETAFQLTEYDGHDELEVGPLHIRFHPVPHFLPTWAIDVRSADGGGRMTYGADSAPNDDLVDVRRGHRPAADRGDAAAPGALRAARAPDARRGRRARPARARWAAWSSRTSPTSSTSCWARGEAERAFGGPVHVAREGDVFVL